MKNSRIMLDRDHKERYGNAREPLQYNQNNQNSECIVRHEENTMLPSREKALLCHRLLARTRALNDLLELRRSLMDIEGPVLTGRGAEAIGIGVCMALLEHGILAESLVHGDQRTQYGFGVGKNEAFPDAHDHAYEILKNYAVAQTSTSEGEDGNIHWGCFEHGIVPFACSDMGRMISVLVGMSEEMRRLTWPAIENSQKRPIAIAAFGEGALNQGGVYESLNWTAPSNCRLTEDEMALHGKWMDDIGKALRVLRGAPMIFIINRNQFSIYTDAREEHGRSNLAARAHGFSNMQGVTVCGWDIFEVIEKTREAIFNAQELRATLMDIETYRLTGHNATQIKHPHVSSEKMILDEGEIIGLDPREYRRACEKYDPLKNCGNDLVSWGYALRKELEDIEQAERTKMAELFDRAWQEPGPILEDRGKKTLLAPHVWSMDFEVRAGATKRMRYNEGFVWEIGNQLRSDNRVTAFGQDIHRGGVLGETAGKGGYMLSAEFGERRVHSAPISEEAITGVGVGRSFAGGKPYIFYQFAPFWADSYPLWRSVIATNWWQKKMACGIRAIFPFGVVHGGGSGEYHEACVEGHLCGMGGVVLLFPTDAYDVVGMLRAAYEYNGPVAIFLQIYAFGNSEFSADVPEDHYVIPFGKARVRREGSDISVLAYGAACVKAALNEAEFLSREKINIEVVDIQSVVPLDISALAASAKKTGRVIIMHEAREDEGCGLHIKNEVDKAGATLRARTPQASYICAAENNPIPTKKKFAWARLPYERYQVEEKDNFGAPRIIVRSSKLAEKCRALMRY